jgi:signal transduction histidine kinase
MFDRRVTRALTAVALLAIAGMLAIHYGTHGQHGTHALLRRLLYLPIVALAVLHGTRAGALAGMTVSLLYLPHAFFAAKLGLHVHEDPSPMVEKVADLLLYVVLGALVGYGVDRARSLVEARRQLETAARLSALGELAAGIAHEVRNPLTSLRTTAEILAEAYPEGHARHRMARLHLEELDRLDAVVGRFLDFAKPSEPSPGPVEARDLLERVRDLLVATARKDSVEIEVEAEDLTFTADRDLLLQAMLNLGLNAVQASPAGGRVRLAAAEAGDRVALTVDDDGAGVPRELGQRVFDPCVTSRADGTGLGLSVATRIAFAHGGALTFAPREHGGTRFSLTLPGGAS